jgi:hypothetical protein
LAQENQTPVAIAAIAKAKIFRLSFLESILCFCVILVCWVPRKEKEGII